LEKLNRNLKNFSTALESLEVLRDEPYSVILRDATLQRFKYTVELFWKTIKVWLRISEGLDCASPKNCIRTAATVGLLDHNEAEQALQMIDVRNLISHSYLEEVAMIIYRRHTDHSALMRTVADRLTSSQ
jgi:nucleotidyltransferase substrate binding protein (TIGR01987 family)